MDKQIPKTPKSVIEILENKRKIDVIEILGHSLYHSDYDIWLYILSQNWFFRRELVLFFNEGSVLDIMITDYWFGRQFKVHLLE